MAKVTPEEYARDWGQGLAQSGERIRRGINRTTEAPGMKAAAQSARYLAGVQAKQELWKQRVGGVSLEDWKKKFIDKGLGRIAAGVTAATAEQVVMAGKLLAAVDAAVTKVNTIPKGDIEASIQRASTFMREMSKAKIR